MCICECHEHIQLDGPYDTNSSRQTPVIGLALEYKKTWLAVSILPSHNMAMIILSGIPTDGGRARIQLGTRLTGSLDPTAGRIRASEKACGKHEPTNRSRS
jgi:hypothetical protein